jgi:hypothetical protein
MRYFILLLFTGCICCTVWSQPQYYAAARSGLSIREQPGVDGKVSDKIPYGQKLELLKDTAEMKAISTEGFNGWWWLVKYNNKTGYVVSSYILNWPPPKTGVKKLQDYFTQLSSPNGNQVVINEPASSDEAESVLKKQLYKNGMEWHEGQGYEYNSALYIIPGYSIEQAFLLLRLLNQYPELIGEKDVFPIKNSGIKTGTAEKTIEVEKENYGDGKQGPVKKIKIIHTQGAITEFEIFMIDTQVLISYNSGV